MSKQVSRQFVPWLIGLLAGLAFVADCCLAATVDPMDWPNWRGPQQNRVSTEKGLVESWDPAGGEGSNLLWKSEELGGRSSPIILRGKLYTIVRDQPNTANEGEKVVCADAATGEKLWEHRFNVYLSEVPPERVGWSCCVADPETGRIYAQGVCGYFCCLEGDTGKVVWDRSLHEEFGLISTYGGRTNVPVVFEDTVLISCVLVDWGDSEKWGGFARPAHRFMEFDKATGQLRWINGTSISPYDTTYSTPTVAVIDGQQQLVFESGDGGAWSLQPRTGQTIWKLTMSRMGANVSPLVLPDGRVIVGHSEENREGTSMGTIAMLDGKLKGDQTGKELWRNYEYMIGKSSPVVVGNRVYAIDDGAMMFAMDLNTGKLIGKKKLGTIMRGTPLYADGKFYVCTNSGQCYILKPSERGVDIVHKVRLEDDTKECDGSPLVSHGRVYIPSARYLYCLGVKDKKPQADPLPELPKESPISEDPTPALVQVVPYDVILRPSEKQSYHVRIFNKRGQLLSTAKPDQVKFSVDGPGTILADGTYQASADNAHDCALVTCQVGELKGTARVRVVPPLPWKWDFNDAKDVPLTWVGGRVRYVVRDVDGQQIIVKKNVLPTPAKKDNKLGTRSSLYMGQTDLANYTIQADVLLTKDNLKLPDVGVINSGYEMIIRAMTKKLRAESWTSHDQRSSAVIDFDAQPDTWYTMKLKVTPEGDTARIQGKVWPRAEKEPATWMLEYVDQAPNLHGSPGLFGSAADAEIFLDNIQVTPNAGSSTASARSKDGNSRGVQR